jgi:hypothetical protein
MRRAGLVPKVSNELILVSMSLIFYSIDAMLNGIIWMTTLQDGAPTN